MDEVQSTHSELVVVRERVAELVDAYGKTSHKDAEALARLQGEIKGAIARHRALVRDLELLAEEQDTEAQAAHVSGLLIQHKQQYETLQRLYKTAVLAVRSGAAASVAEERRALLGSAEGREKIKALRALGSEEGTLQVAAGITDSLRRTRQMMVQELEHTSATFAVLEESNRRLAASKDELQGQSPLTRASRRLLATMRTHSLFDWAVLWGGVAFFFLVVAYIASKRLGYFVPSAITSALWRAGPRAGGGVVEVPPGVAVREGLYYTYEDAPQESHFRDEAGLVWDEAGALHEPPQSLFAEPASEAEGASEDLVAGPDSTLGQLGVQHMHPEGQHRQYPEEAGAYEGAAAHAWEQEDGLRADSSDERLTERLRQQQATIEADAAAQAAAERRTMEYEYYRAQQEAAAAAAAAASGGSLHATGWGNAGGHGWAPPVVHDATAAAAAAAAAAEVHQHKLPPLERTVAPGMEGEEGPVDPALAVEKGEEGEEDGVHEGYDATYFVRRSEKQPPGVATAAPAVRAGPPAAEPAVAPGMAVPKGWGGGDLDADVDEVDDDDGAVHEGYSTSYYEAKTGDQVMEALDVPAAQPVEPLLAEAGVDPFTEREEGRSEEDEQVEDGETAALAQEVDVGDVGPDYDASGDLDVAEAACEAAALGGDSDTDAAQGPALERVSALDADRKELQIEQVGIDAGDDGVEETTAAREGDAEEEVVAQEKEEEEEEEAVTQHWEEVVAQEGEEEKEEEAVAQHWEEVVAQEEEEEEAREKDAVPVEEVEEAREGNALAQQEEEEAVMNEEGDAQVEGDAVEQGEGEVMAQVEGDAVGQGEEEAMAQVEGETAWKDEDEDGMHEQGGTETPDATYLYDDDEDQGFDYASEVYDTDDDEYGENQALNNDYAQGEEDEHMDPDEHAEEEGVSKMALDLLDVEEAWGIGDNSVDMEVGREEKSTAAPTLAVDDKEVGQEGYEIYPPAPAGIATGGARTEDRGDKDEL